MSAGQIAINTNEASPGLFFKDSNGDLVKVGPVHIGTTAPNSSPDSVAATALVTGTVYQILTVGTSDFTLVGASANTVGTIFTATGTTTGTGTVSGQQGVEKGEQWLDTTGGAYDLKIYDGTSWRSQAGEFVNVTGDTMTGALLLDNAASVSAPDLSFDGDANTGIYSPGADQFAVATAGTAALTIDASQRVGIGTASPNAPVEIQSATGNFAATYNNFNGVSLFVSNDGTTGDGNTSGAIAFDSPDRSGSKHAAIVPVQTGADSNQVGLTFWVHPSTTRQTDLSEAMRIDSSGRLLIGTTTTGGASTYYDDLVISNTGSGTGCGITLLANATNGFNSIDFGDTDSASRGRLTYSHADDSLRIDTAGTERMRINSSGNIGIGTTSPDTDISGSAQGLSVAHSNVAFLSVENTAASGKRYTLYANDSGSLVTYDEDANTERMRIDSSGRIGIGTTSPSTKFVVSNSGAEGLEFNHSSGTSEISSYNRSTSARAPVDLIGQTFKVLTGNPSLSTGLFQDSSGNVGIGTTSPATSVHVRDSVAVLTLQADNGNSCQVLFGAASDVSRGNITYDNSDESLQFKNNNNQERMRIDSSGNVGIGTSTPDLALSVNGAVNLRNSTRAGAFEITSGGDLWMGTATTAGNIYLETGHSATGLPSTGTARVTINSTGVGIGTTSPGATLHIHGGGGKIRFGTNLSFYSEISHDTSVTANIVYNNRDNAGHQFMQNDTTELARIDSSGRLLVGTVSGSYQLQLSTDSAGKPSTNTWTIVSDERIKEEIELADLDICYEAVKNIPLKRFKWKDEVYTEEQAYDRRKLGWIAQDVEAVFPKAVRQHEFKYNQVFEEVVIPAVPAELDDDGNIITEEQPERIEKGELISEEVIEDCRDLNSDQLYAAMYGAIQKLISKVELLEAEVQALKAA
jgi:hypothetical protein